MPVISSRKRAGFALAAIAILLVMTLPADAQNSLGLGRPEQIIRPEGYFAPVLLWIQAQQQAFYQAMTDALKSIRSGGGGAWLLAGLSFAYGVLHAAGPGHGKAVISSYMLANEVQLKRGIVLSFGSALLQALTAIAMIGALTLVLRGLGYRSADMTRYLEIASYAAITLLGAWLLWRKLTGGGHGHEHGHSHGHTHSHEHEHHHHGHEHHDHGHGHHGHEDHGHHHLNAGEAACPDCGHMHAPDPALLEGKIGLREAWSAVLAVGLRPCSGALIVLTFAFLNGLYAAGIASVFAMAAGTGITVAALASLAVGAKSLALRLSGADRASERVHRIIEITGAGLVFLLGATLLAASLY